VKVKKLKNSSCSREYTIRMKGYKVYCTVCNRRAGVFNAYCGKESKKQNRNWKNYRKTKWK